MPYLILPAGLSLSLVPRQKSPQELNLIICSFCGIWCRLGEESSCPTSLSSCEAALQQFILNGGRRFSRSFLSVTVRNSRQRLNGDLSCLRPIIDWLSSGLSLIPILATLKAPDADMKARPHPFLLCVYDGFPRKVPRTPVIPAGNPLGSDLPLLHDLRQELR